MQTFVVFRSSHDVVCVRVIDPTTQLATDLQRQSCTPIYLLSIFINS